MIVGVVSHPEMDRQLPAPCVTYNVMVLLQATEAEPLSDSHSDDDCVIVFDSNRMIEAGGPPEVRNVSRDLSHCQIYVNT